MTNGVFTNHPATPGWPQCFGSLVARVDRLMLDLGWTLRGPTGPTSECWRA
ncbi:MAG: hypothetical protein AVDCRST_MAG87-732 [uncultured Thermomicrobiales bacterium]|uniref:Uncharacterized protein n=1 Tax=uncultured Thermomicrobiales bacterium TaxID=1645740 RepID=A0A6J4UHX8_9BACT|nr:MAG: hypothetical protein AVDCRST_MAG87-732 [uncultured Thermomicrobiales bacterium]